MPFVRILAGAPESVPKRQSLKNARKEFCLTKPVMKMKKIILLFLSTVMLLSCVTSCKPKNPQPSGSETPIVSGEPTSSASQTENAGASSTPEATPSETLPDTKTEFEKIGIPNVNYQESTIYVFHWDAGYPEYEVNRLENDGDPILDAIYKRNLYTEQLLNVELDFTRELGDGSKQKEFADALSRRIENPDTPVDIVSAYGRTMGVVTLSGLLTDLYEYENLDFSKEWWPKDMQSEYKIKDRLYFISGDISTNLLHMMYAIYYNLDLAERFGVGDLVSKVNNLDWTLDDLIRCSSGVYQDMSGDGKSDDDFFGAAFAFFHMDALVLGCNFRLAEPSEKEGEAIRFTDEFFGETFGEFIDKMIAWVHSNDVLNDTTYSNSADPAFLDSRAIFRISTAGYGASLKKSDVKFGILPSPMLNKEQGRYYTCIANGFSAYGICRKSPDGDRAATVMQTMGYYGKTLTTPAIFEVTYQGKLSVTGEYMGMFEIIRDSISFDIGRIYHLQLNVLADYPTNEAISKGRPWSVVMGPFTKNNLNNLMRKLNISLLALD